AAFLDRAAGAAGRGHLWPAAGGGVVAVRVGGGGLRDRVAEPRRTAEDEPPGHAGRVQGDRRFAAGAQPDSRAAAAVAAPAGEGGRKPRRRGADQSHALRGGAGIRFRNHGSAQGPGQGAQPAGGGDQGGGPLGGRADCRESAAGAIALSIGRSGPADSGGSLCCRGRDSGLSLPAEGRERNPRSAGTRSGGQNAGRVAAICRSGRRRFRQSICGTRYIARSRMSTTAVVPAPLGGLAFLARFKDYVLPFVAISVIFVMLV